MFDTGQQLVQLSDGSVCTEDVMGIVEKIRAYDDTLDVLYLDPSKFPDITDAPYIIVKRTPEGRRVRIFSCWELDERAYKRVVLADTLRNDVQKMIDDHNVKVAVEKEKQRTEVMEDAADKTKHILANPKTTYKIRNDKGELVTIEDDKGVVKRQ